MAAPAMSAAPNPSARRFVSRWRRAVPRWTSGTVSRASVLMGDSWEIRMRSACGFGMAAVVAAAGRGVARLDSRCGGRAGHHAKARIAQGQAGYLIDQQRLHFLARLRIDELHRFAFGREVAIAPVEQGEQYGPEAATALGEQVFKAAAMAAVLLAFEQAGIHQLHQPARQHVRGDAQALLEFLESAQAQEGIAQDQDAPPLAHLLEAAGDGALSPAEVFALRHDVPINLKVMPSYNYQNESQ